MQCLMIRTSDSRRFFTYKKNIPYLIEFSKTFSAELSIVTILEKENILILENLVPLLCDGTKNQNSVEFTLVEILSKKPKSRKDLMENAKVVREFIKKELLSGKKVVVKDIKNHFDISPSSISNHLKVISLDLRKNGKNLTKVETGTYAVE